MPKIDRDRVKELVAARRETAEKLAALSDDIHEIAVAVAGCLDAGGTVYACGNGGSATEATHFVAELVGRFKRDRRALPAFSLSDNNAAVTALANDYDYDDIFAHQLRGLGRRGDCLLALSTSGGSPNVVHACRAARDRGMRVFGLTGAAGAGMKSICDIALCVDFDDTARIQEVHLMVIHLVCELVEESLFGDSATTG